MQGRAKRGLNWGTRYPNFVRLQWRARPGLNFNLSIFCRSGALHVNFQGRPWCTLRLLAGYVRRSKCSLTSGVTILYPIWPGLRVQWEKAGPSAGRDDLQRSAKCAAVFGTVPLLAFWAFTVKMSPRSARLFFHCKRGLSFTHSLKCAEKYMHHVHIESISYAPQVHILPSYLNDSFSNGVKGFAIMV